VVAKANKVFELINRNFTDRSRETIIPLIRYDTKQWTILTCTQKLMSSQLNLLHRNQTKKNNEETKNKKWRCSEEFGPAVKSVESVLRLKGSLWWERYVKGVGLDRE